MPLIKQHQTATVLLGGWVDCRSFGASFKLSSYIWTFSGQATEMLMELNHHQEIFLLFHICFSFMFFFKYLVYVPLRTFSQLWTWESVISKTTKAKNGSHWEQKCSLLWQEIKPFLHVSFQWLLIAPHITILLIFYVIPSNLCKAPTSGEQLGILFLINAECHECSTLLLLTFNICLSLSFLLMESDPICKAIRKFSDIVPNFPQ